MDKEDQEKQTVIVSLIDLKDELARDNQPLKQRLAKDVLQTISDVSSSKVQGIVLIKKYDTLVGKFSSAFFNEDLQLDAAQKTAWENFKSLIQKNAHDGQKGFGILRSLTLPR